jgi:TonB family protein
MISTMLGSLLAGVLAVGPLAQEPPVKPGDGVTMPVVVREVRPVYTAAAVRRALSGMVKLDVIVETDGSVGDVRVATSLDPELDDAAVRAMKQWQFKPGMRSGQPVPVRIEVEMSFTLRGNRLDSDRVFKPGSGVRVPTVLKEVKPQYTTAARDADIQGIVTLDCVVEPDGSVGDTRVVKGLDPELDKRAIAALKQWRFKAGELDGRPVAVQVSVEITFALK